jgi:DnaK suppressor protein
MNSKTHPLDQAFIEKQRHKLTTLRAELLRTTQASETEEAQITAQSLGEAHESEDDAQRLAMLEIEGHVVARDLQRLSRVERALQKIDEGTYGFSDTGQPIPRERLEAIPEA